MILEFRSHDAETAGATLPFGHAGHDRRVRLNLFGERGVHFSRGQDSGCGRFVKFNAAAAVAVIIVILIAGRNGLRLGMKKFSPLVELAARARLNPLT
jgi:hypothetical protein